MTCHKLQRPRASGAPHQTPAPSPLRPHVLAPNRLMRWLTPFGVSHMNSLLQFFPHRIIAMSHVLLSKYVAPMMLSNYSSGLLCFCWFCDDYSIPEPLRMPASEALLTLFITCHGMGSMSASTMHHWLLSLELWHEINSAPWCGRSTLKCAVKVTSPMMCTPPLLTLAQAAALLAPKHSLKPHDPMTIQHLKCL